jgi:polyisoprenoid-binding protein YceI
MKRTLLAAVLALASTAAFAAPLTYKIDPNHTDVTARWSHFGFSHPIAHFGKVDGFITYDPAKVGASKVEVTIPLSGLNSHVPDFDDHLRSDDFFDAEKYPTITFRSTSVQAAGKDRLKVTGDLTVKGITRSVVLEHHHRSDRAQAGRVSFTDPSPGTTGRTCGPFFLDLRGSVWASIKCQQGLSCRKKGFLNVDGAIAHRLPIRVKSGSLAGRAKRKASARCAAGSLSFSGQKESDQRKGPSPTEQT